MYCPKCGTENPEDAQLCRSCSWVLTSTPTTATSPRTKTSGLAITSLVLGVLTPFSCFLTAIPAITLGIISLVKIERSGGKLTGRGFAIAGIVAPVVMISVFMVWIVMGLSYKIKLARHVICRSNLHQWGIVWKMYTDDNGGYFIEDPNWLDPLRPYYSDEKLLFCPMATKSQDEGAQIPFAAWRNADLKGSYGLNLWVTQSTEGGRSQEKLWKTPNVKGAGYVPMFLDCSSSTVSPLHSDIPPEHDGQPNSEGTNQMKECCINRHNAAVNVAFLDFSSRSIGLKELWELKWHRNWNPDNDPPPEWPEWMKNFKDYPSNSNLKHREPQRR